MIPEISEVETMVAWGKSNRELFLSDADPRYAPETRRQWIRDPRDDIILVTKDLRYISWYVFGYTLRDFAYRSILYVDKPYRGMGVGMALLNRAENDLKRKHIPELGLFAEEGYDDSRAFYEKVGFAPGHVFRWMGRKI